MGISAQEHVAGRQQRWRHAKRRRTMMEGKGREGNGGKKWRGDKSAQEHRRVIESKGHRGELKVLFRGGV